MRIIIEVEGGCVTSVTAEGPVEVMLVDYDVMGLPDEDRRRFGPQESWADIRVYDADDERPALVSDAFEYVRTHGGEGQQQGYFVEFNGDCWQSVFPEEDADQSALHTSIDEALAYMTHECGIPRDAITVLGAGK